MTTWCRHPERDSTSSNRRRSSLAAAAATNKKRLDGRSSPPIDGHLRSQQSVSRHSIADILGWTHGASVKVEQLDSPPPGYLPQRETIDTSEAMASDYVDMADMVMSDEPLDLSLDKSKCRRVERERENTAAIKRAKVVVDAMEPASDGGTDEADMDASPWGNVQPHLQMAANFSTVLQYYLTAARLWQTSEVIRCQESQQRAETDSEPNETGDDGHQSDTTAAVVAAVAAAAAAAAAGDSVAPVQSQPSSKRRKKDHLVADLAATGDGSRPRKTRTTFTGKQLFELERIFEQKKYLSSNERQEVARLLNVTGSQIKIWFQNRRTKWKKQDPNTAAELAQLKSASRSQQQSTSVSKGKSGSDQAGSTTTSAANVADISGGEDGNSDASSPPRSPSPA